jgi:hypothetical protein
MLTNMGNISLPIAVWLAADDYDLVARPNVISATGLLKPIKTIALTQKISQANIDADTDLQDLIPSRLGTAIHDAVEKAWLNNLEQALTAMGIPERVRKTIRVNPTEIDPDYHNIFLEQRMEKSLDGFTISGKYDIVDEGRVKDIKSTGTYNWIHGGNDAKYAWQGSIYRWLDPETITDNVMDVEYVFTDWKALSAKTDKKYPPRRVMTRTLPLKSLSETEHFIRVKIRNLKQYLGKPESEIPRCTPEELWQRPTTWAYYKNPQKTARATKVFENHHEAMSRQAADGNVGKIVERKGEVKFCTYCSGRPVCQQAEAYVQQGLLEI